jgi:hypothetical protein
MKAAFLTSSLIAPKGKALPASPRTAPTKLLDDESNRQSGVSRIYQRVREYAEPHEENEPSLVSDVQNQEEHYSSAHEEFDSTDDAILLHEDETVSISSEIDVYDFSKPEETNRARTEHGQNEHQGEAPKEETSPLLVHHTLTDDVVTPNNRLQKSKPVDPLSTEKIDEIATEVSKLTKDKLGRIRISVRMAPKDHLQLKLIAAHTQMSAQAIFETALEEYVSNHGSSILPDSCSCVLDKSSL